MDANLPDVGGAKAGVVYDFYNAEVTSIYATVDAYAGKRVVVSADYDYYVPTFDADSIWNIFAGEPLNDVGLRCTWIRTTTACRSLARGALRMLQRADIALQPGQRRRATRRRRTSYCARPTSFLNRRPSSSDEAGANLSARWKTGETTVNLHASGNWGDEGDRVGADLYATRIFETRYVASARVGVWQWDDKLEPDRSATSFNYVLGVGYRFAQRSQAMVEWEHDINRLVGERFRLMVMLKLAVTK